MPHLEFRQKRSQTIRLIFCTSQPNTSGKTEDEEKVIFKSQYLEKYFYQVYEYNKCECPLHTISEKNNKRVVSCIED